MEYDFNYLDNIPSTAKNKILKTLDEFSEYICFVKEKTKEYNIGNNSNFNIFSSISDIYYRENLHSDIIKFILDPSTY